MNPFRCLFKPFRHHEATKMERLAEDELTQSLNAASESQKKAVLGVKTAAFKQMREADYIRETLHGVLSRIEEREREQKQNG